MHTQNACSRRKDLSHVARIVTDLNEAVIHKLETKFLNMILFDYQGNNIVSFAQLILKQSPFLLYISPFYIINSDNTSEDGINHNTLILADVQKNIESLISDRRI